MVNKQFFKQGLIIISVVQPFLLGACPYTIHNDTQVAVFIANTKKGGSLLKKEGKVEVVAPETKPGAKYSHKPIYVYEQKNDGNFIYLARIQEVQCGKDSHVYISKIEQESPGDHTSGRFLITKDSE
ncbi:MAG: hypothetical protein WA432_04355 [Candidatus Babeliaceae bacterium]